jgi:arabinoxylan arabinofuranohydrolase
MKDWWIWSSDDLVNWKHECTIDPADTYIGPLNSCWAVDAEEKNGFYYLYVSAGSENIGVLKSESPVGPWTSPLDHHMLTSGSAPTVTRDPAIFTDEKGDSYILFGLHNFCIAKLNEDMISLAETPKKIEVINPRGPYNLDGKNKKEPMDDKVDLHKYKGKYYLSWGSFYAMSDNLYGPYECKGSIIVEENVSPEFRNQDLNYDRHGKYFEWNGQWYFVCNDMSQPDSRWYFRNIIISKVFYKENGEIEFIKINREGVMQK